MCLLASARAGKYVIPLGLCCKDLQDRGLGVVGRFRRAMEGVNASKRSLEVATTASLVMACDGDTLPLVYTHDSLMGNELGVRIYAAV
jgi:hypothetical protein